MRNLRRPWNKVFIETTDKEGQKTRSELEAPVYPKKTRGSWYNEQTNGLLTLEQEKAITEKVNNLVEEKNKEKNKCSK